MLDNFVISINVSARSIGRGETGEREECARFGSSIAIDGSWNTNKTVVQPAYEKNKEETKSDFSKFEDSIDGFSKDIYPAVSELVEKFKQELEQELASRQG